MKGLVVKDLLVLKQQGKVIGILLGFYIILAIVTENPSMFGSILGVICIIFPVTALSYDESAKWDKYALTMPISRTDMVVSKYILGLLFSVGAFIANFVFFIVMTLVTTVGPEMTIAGAASQGIMSSLAIFSFSLVFMSLVLPVLFKYGVEKGRIMMILIMFIPTALILLLGKYVIDISESLLEGILFPSSALIGILMFIASIWVSIKIYRKKEF